MAIRRALLSVSDKFGLIPFAQALTKRGVELLSTGGTYRALVAAGIAVRTVEEYTGSPEVMDGRVKTLHPRVHGALLAREGRDDADLERIGGRLIDLVVVNLYPFESTLADPASSYEQLVENIDIGGPSMLRSAAKNHMRVAVLCDHGDYDSVLEELDHSGELSLETRRRLAAKAFAHTAGYDGAIAGWLSTHDEPDGHPRHRVLAFDKCYGLRYGENPHQKGAFYRERQAQLGSLARAQSLGVGKKQLSFNNLVDVEAAVEAVREFPRPAAVVIKHASPCGLASAPTLADAYRAAREADALSAFGGIVALNREVDEITAQTIAETFIECVIAPNYTEAALETLKSKKKNLRILATGSWLPADYEALQFKRVGGGIVFQDRDATGGKEVREGQVATERAPSDEELEVLEFGWLCCKHVKSNAIVLAAQGASGSLATIGIGGGQTSRVGAVNVACETAGERARGSVLASDAFFPFPDGIERAAEAGITAIAQPGGSKQDQTVIDAANARGLAMVMTGVRHFRH